MRCGRNRVGAVRGGDFGVRRVRYGYIESFGCDHLCFCRSLGEARGGNGDSDNLC